MEKETRTEIVKKHFKDNKELYIGIGIGIVTGATIGLVTSNRNKITIQKLKAGIVMAATDNGVNTINIEMKGHPGNIIEDVNTGILYPSQNSIAEALGVSASNIGRYLAGEKEIEGLNLINHGPNLGGVVKS